MKNYTKQFYWTNFLRIFFELTKKDLYIYYRESFVSEWINNAIVNILINFVVGHIMPSLGLPISYGFFFAISMIMAIPFWDNFGKTGMIMGDWEGDNSFGYYSTLPIPFYLYLLQKIFVFTVRSIAMIFCIIPILILLTLKSACFAQISILKMIVAIIMGASFCSALTFLMLSISKHMGELGNICIRTMLPLWFIGGTEYTWSTINAIHPKISYFCLLNPMLYIMESLHAAIIGASGYINFWMCVAAVVASIVLMSFYSFTKIKRRFDVL
jgi:ABC-type polysaccharide/polyol phosphate export permease